MLWTSYMNGPQDPKPDLKLEHDRLRLELDCGVGTGSFGGLVVVAWHADGQALGKGRYLNDVRTCWEFLPPPSVTVTLTQLIRLDYPLLDMQTSCKYCPKGPQL